MPVQALFGLSVLLSFVASGIVVKLYIAPKLKAKRREDALLPLVIPHMFRFVGLSAVFAGMIGVTAFGLIFTPGFYVICRWLAALGPKARSTTVWHNTRSYLQGG